MSVQTSPYRSIISAPIILAAATISMLLASLCGTLNAQPASSGSRDLAGMIRGGDRPRLVVVVSIDQFRADLLTRLHGIFRAPVGPTGDVGGFRYLMERGAYFVDAHHEHFPLETGPGHAVILTGGYPSKTGIVANDWWDRQGRRPVYCAGDPSQRVVGQRIGSSARPMGPLHLRATTVGDELKLATGKQSVVVSIGIKDRVAVLMGGHMADACIWFDESAGNWISSTAYCPDGTLPTWVQTLNGRKIPEQSLGTVWESTLPQEIHALAIRDNVPATPSNGMRDAFPHPIGAEANPTNFKAFRVTPAANEYVFTAAREAITAHKLGADEIPDLLAIGLAANDYAGHAYGPYSLEVFDVMVETDIQLARFLNHLRTTIPGGLDEVVVVVTGDHGAAPIPESAREQGMSAGRIFRRDLLKAAEDGLTAAYGEGPWLSIRGATFNLDSIDATVDAGGYVDPYLYIDDAAVARAIGAGRARSRSEVEEAAARAVERLPGVYACYTRSQIMNGSLPPTDISRHVANGFYPRVSGDVLVVPEPFHQEFDRPNQYAASHGSPYSYDSHVPILIAGPGIVPGIEIERVSVADIAPTLSLLLGIAAPSGCDGVVLVEALR